MFRLDDLVLLALHRGNHTGTAITTYVQETWDEEVGKNAFLVLQRLHEGGYARPSATALKMRGSPKEWRLTRSGRQRVFDLIRGCQDFLDEAEAQLLEI